MFSEEEESDFLHMSVLVGLCLLFLGFTFFVVFNSGVLLLKSKIVVHKVSVMVPLLLEVVGFLDGCFPLGS